MSQQPRLRSELLMATLACEGLAFLVRKRNNFDVLDDPLQTSALVYVDVRTPVVEPTPRHIPLGYIAIVRRLGISRCHPLGVGCAYLVAKSKH